MIKAYTNENQISIIMNEDECEKSYNLGDNIMRFLWMPLNEIEALFYEYSKCSANLNYIERQSSRERNNYRKNILFICPYLEFYTILLDELTIYTPIYAEGNNVHNLFSYNFFHPLHDFQVQLSGNNLDSSYYKDIENIEYYYEVDEPSNELVDKTITSAIHIIICDIKLKREIIRGELEFILKMKKDDLLASITPMQRLVYYDSVREYSKFIEDEFTISYIKVPNIPIKYNSKIDFIKELESKNISYVYAYTIDRLDILIRYEIHQIIIYDIIINKCHFCGSYFVPAGRKDAKYCSMVSSTKSAPCSKIGARRIHEDKIKSDTIMRTHRKAYDKMMSRFRRGKISQLELFKWSEKSREIRQKCIDGKISVEELEKLLD